MLSSEATGLQGSRSREGSGSVQHQQGESCHTLTGAGNRVVIRDQSQSSGNGNQMTRVGDVNGRLIAGTIIRILAEKARERTLAKGGISPKGNFLVYSR